ncbi:Phosphate regulon transcriptional regulatory protein PhoB [Aliarcobacter thereius]|uniref:Phosphate regulon transcriptional regulatory protein PhoB n=2 Tax=Aliarcobacter thereius TaxID=544718 RepID=A0A1C0B9Z9_9BACT|nr:response regulator transcription factor [Aliarcobacter thereius]OCL88467.1 Phosphate regulon transcriptional regulatory protein PhoB [Aliarcobacter thereius]OCL91957.1 Phosphate regulon transcriptional regulatory protein PhoB [Aliarcobacter thereius]OCL94945.1 Phosphate regulon transcriptional regulatory protein PhoB [Aliarcobacter thereius LMG 24486]OCM00393.1 Phosphate regulon transcriptional regulatory protein PhoB [Aliarcobacter thereius]QBF15182.1 two-component system response regulato
MKNKLILIVEDEEDMLELLEYTLQKEGYETIGFLSINENVNKILEEEKIDLILMDRNLPGVEGTSFINSIKKDGYQIPVIYVTAKDKDEDILDGFESYADDYITKPFNIKELCARVKAVIKRTSNESENIKIRDILYKSSNKSFYIDEKRVNLSQLETKLLLEFIKNQNILLSREHLLENIWQDALDKQEKTVNVAIKRLKDKIDPNGKKDYIKAVRGEGYIFC